MNLARKQPTTPVRPETSSWKHKFLKNHEVILILPKRQILLHLINYEIFFQFRVFSQVKYTFFALFLDELQELLKSL